MLVAGIFVGGRATRMGGVAKGLVTTREGESIVARTRRLVERVGATCVLVGEHASYAGLGLPVIADDPRAEGPLAGLVALLGCAPSRALALACDMPFLTAALLERLVEAPDAPVVAARRSDRWEPFFARYDAPRVLPLALGLALRRRGGRLQDLLSEAGTCALPLSPDEELALEDWDSAGDVTRGGGRTV